METKKKRYLIVSFLAVFVVLLTAYTLMLPAITAERDALCGMEEHTHSNECYQTAEGRPLTIGECIPEGTVVHHHDDACYEDGVLTCTLPEIEAHSHEDSCYDEEHNLICGKDEVILHEHMSECFDETGALICEKEEVREHQHTEECMTAIKESAVLVCGQEEHQHTEACYEEETLSKEPSVADEQDKQDKPEVLAVGDEVTTFAELRTAITNKQENIVLGADITVNEGLTPSGNLTLDLNGHKLNTSGTGTVFTVNGGTTMTLKDSKMPKETVSGVGGNTYGNKGTFGNGVLTYYVTTSQINNSSTGATTETLEKHSLQVAGGINCGGCRAFNVNGGTVNIDSGVIYGGSRRAVRLNNGTVNMNGGYICGFSSGTEDFGHGGAFYIDNGTLNLSGGVIAANTSSGNGGAMAVRNNAKVNITGGIISGNTAKRNNVEYEGGAHNGGGGLYCVGNSVITMDGGYLTNNVVDANVYFDGGGGAMMSGSSSFILNGGYVTGNLASGGGGLRTNFQNSAKITMNGGFVSGNMASSTEGGGIAIDRGGVGTINGGYITNNTADTKHWGGGGLFCADGSDLYLKRVLITENEAGGFGGGIAGCPTGKIYLYVDEGGAAFDNRDMVDGDSPHFVGDGVKQIDQELCTDFFQSHGHKEFFCALRSTVLGTMLGGGAAGWEGTADYNEVKLGADDVQTAERVMGLETNPSDEAKAAAIASATVYINGNYSYTHGGGILCNGNLIFGNAKDIEVPAHLSIKGNKKLVNEAGKDLSLEGNDFKFTVTDKDGKELAVGTCDKDGNISITPDVNLKEGTHTIFVRESKDNAHPEIKYDGTQYRLTVKVVRDNGVKWYGDTMKYTHNIESIKVEKSTDGKQWTQISSKTYNPVQNIVEVDLTPGTASFVNEKSEKTNITVNKVWADDKPGANEVTVKLYRGDEVIDTVTLNKDNNWTHTWTDLPVGNGAYHIEEVKVPGYKGTISTTQDEDGNTIITITNSPDEYEPILPETGGTGTELYMAAGLLLIGISLCFAWRRLRENN